MGMLDENIGDGLDRRIRAVAEFKFGFQLSSPLLLSDNEKLVYIANENGFITDSAYLSEDSGIYRFFDLAQLQSGDYNRILAAVCGGVDGIVFWNADRVSAKGSEKDRIEDMIRSALKSDLWPTDIRPQEPIDFSTMKVVVHCSELPQYLAGSLGGVFIVDTETIQ